MIFLYYFHIITHVKLLTILFCLVLIVITYNKMLLTLILPLR